MKMPEPVAWTNPSWLSNPHAGHYSARKTECFNTPLYDKQALIDLLEAAAVECESKSVNGNYRFDTRHECAYAIRELKETL